MGQARHKQGHVSPLSDKVLINNSKQHQLIESGINFIDRDNKADILLGKRIQQKGHPASPIEHWLVGIVPFNTH